jgi:hypothetical protein
MKCDTKSCTTTATWHDSVLQKDGSTKEINLCFDHSPLPKDLKGKELKQAQDYHAELRSQTK